MGSLRVVLLAALLNVCAGSHQAAFTFPTAVAPSPRSVLCVHNQASEVCSGCLIPRQHARSRLSLCSVQASASREPSDTPEERNQPSEEWREFRAKLVQSEEQNRTGGQIEDIWAHVTAQPEVGGVLCRLPIEAQISHLMHEGPTSELGRRLGLRFEEEIRSVGGEQDTMEDLNRRRKTWAGNLAFMYKLSHGLVQEGLEGLMEKAKAGITTDRLDAKERELLAMYNSYMESREEVLLVIGHDGETSTTVGINTPIQRGLDIRFASRLLIGAGSDPTKVWGGALLANFVAAFGREGAVFYGGPDRESRPGRMLHGFADLEGAREVGEGSGIYVGGVEAAVKAVRSGTHRADDFLFLIGCREWASGGLAEALARGEYQSVACGRSVALERGKQAPESLWTEVMELCGGASSELSQLARAHRVAEAEAAAAKLRRSE